MLLNILFVQFLYSQETEETESSPLTVSADLVSSYIWRGTTSSASPNFQPYINLSFEHVTFGFWGSTDFIGQYKEIDFYSEYRLKGFTLYLNDYYCNTQKKDFNFKRTTTGHIVEAGLSYENENFPLRIYAGSFIWGEDKQFFYNTAVTDTTMNNLSTYFELNYTFNIRGNDLNVFCGFTPFTGFYGEDIGVVYSCITLSKKITITKNFSLTVFGTFATNPMTEDFFAIVGKTF